jgi:hypothetical protein
MSARQRAAVAVIAGASIALAPENAASSLRRGTEPPAAPSPAVISQTAQAVLPGDRVGLLAAWQRAVEEHRPGEMDEPLRLVSSATERELTCVLEDLREALRLPKRASGGPGNRAIKKRSVDSTDAGVREPVGLAGRDTAMSHVNSVLMRGAILHANVEMLVRQNMTERAGCSTPSAVFVQDGQRVGTGCGGKHWAMARALLDAISPHPWDEPMVRLWYQATMAYLLENGDYAYAVNQIDRGLVLFPDDPALLVDRGRYHEAFASPYVQPAAQAGGSDERSAAAHLKEAEGLFRRALDANPDFVEARVHHGVVLGALGRHEEAAVELRSAAASARGPVLRYYAALFLGDEEQAVGRRDESRARYEEAAALFPLAQAPRMALSHLARRYGDRSGALRALRDALTRSAGRDWRSDPRWSYHRWLNESSEVLLGELYRPFLAGGSR